MKNIISVLFLSLLLSNNAYADDRTVLLVNAEQRDFLLTEMRQMLLSSQQILEGIVNDDMEMVEQAARTSGMKMGRSTPDSIRQLLPDGFKALGPLSHRGFEKIANEADGFGDKETILKLLSEAQKSCVACHQTYQLRVGE